MCPRPSLLLKSLLLALLALGSACSSRQPAGDLPRTARQELEQGLKLTRQHQHAAALQQFQKAYRRAPGHPPLLLNQGLAHSQLQQHGAAAGWFNAWLATGLASPQRGAIEQQFRREKEAAKASATPLLQQAIHDLFRQLPDSRDETLARQASRLAHDMAAAGDVYGALKLLSECERLLAAQARPRAWLQTARDQSWEAYALTLALTRQLLPAEQARSNIDNERQRHSFWARLAKAPDQAYRHLPAPLNTGQDWLRPLAAQHATPPLTATASPPRPPLRERSRQLAEAMARAEQQLAATHRSTVTTSDPAAVANTYNLLLFLIEASAAERHTASP